VPTHPERSPQDLGRDYERPLLRHEPLRGQDGMALGVEPLSRSVAPDPEDSGLARRARRVGSNRWRSVPPPGA
jgi:hypothetical protein